MRTFLGALVLALSLPVAAQAPATGWPAKAVRVIVPYAAGSTPDTIARLIFDRVRKSTGQPVIVENRPGAAGMIGADQVAKAAPDGHTLVLAPSGPLATDALLYKKMPYDPAKELAPVALVAETPAILVASNATPAVDAPGLLKAMAAGQHRMAYASPGAGTLGHLSMAYLVALAGATDVPHVPYAGSPQIITALIADDVQLAALPPLAVAPQVKAGKIKAIATIGPRRSSALPGVPTLREAGIDFAPVGWFGIATTAGTPPAVLEAIHQRIASALKDPDVAKAFRMQGLDVADQGPKAFAAYIAEEIARWRPIIRRFGIALD